MIANWYLALAVAMLTVHLLFTIWVVFGVVVTASRPKLAGLHIASIVWGVVIENVSWPCPLTLAENWFQGRAGLEPYQGPFVLHYLQLTVYPNLPLWVLQWGAVGVGLANLAVYVRRYSRAKSKSFGGSIPVSVVPLKDLQKPQ